MSKMVELTQNEGPLSSLTQSRIKELAKQLIFYPGVPECFRSITEEVMNAPAFRAAGIRVETYVISGGIAELLRASVLADAAHYIWGCDFSYDAREVIVFPRTSSHSQTRRASFT